MEGYAETRASFAVLAAGFVSARELCYCILDRMLHTALIIALFALAAFLFLFFYYERGYLKFRRLALLFGVLAIAALIAAAAWSKKVFNSFELFNGGIGYAGVKWFRQDAYCFSNGRETTIFGGQSFDLYITDEQDAERKIVSHFQRMDPRLAYVKRDAKYGDSFGLYLTDPDEPVLVAFRFPKDGYVVWEIQAQDRYRYQDIWGGVPRFQRADIHPRGS